MKLYFLGFLSGLLVIGFSVLIDGLDEPSTQIQQRSHSIFPADDGDKNSLALTVKNLQEENKQLRFELGNLRQSFSQLNELTAKNLHEAAQENTLLEQRGNEAIAAALRVQEQVSQLGEFIRTNPDVDISLMTRENFEREAVDAYWAKDYQLKLDNYLRSETSLSDIIPQAIECRTHLCRVSIAVQDQTQINQFSQLIFDSLLENNAGISKKIMFDQDADKSLLNFYIVKNDGEAFVN